MAAEAHHIIREQVARSLSREIADKMRILYGGSVKPENATALMSQEEIDGALVGGASLDPQSFAKIVLLLGQRFYAACIFKSGTAQPAFRARLRRSFRFACRNCRFFRIQQTSCPYALSSSITVSFCPVRRNRMRAHVCSRFPVFHRKSSTRITGAIDWITTKAH